tara:strand:- start:2794 stop:3849 length:1056 start_codon:yes stop_codon:yes gene_type:complete
MAFIVADDVQDTTTTVGTISLTLSGTAPASYQTFLAGIGNGNTTCYAIRDGSDVEVGIGTLTGGVTLSRDTVLFSTNGNAKVNWASGTKYVYCNASAKLVVMLSAALAGAGDAGKLVKVNAAGNGCDLIPQGTGGALDADKLDGKHYTDINPMTTQGDIIVAGASGVPGRLARGSAGTYPRSNGTTMLSSAIDGADVGTGTIPTARLPAASTIASGIMRQATTAEVTSEAASAFPDAASLKYHKGVGKVSCIWDGTGVPAITGSYNVSSLTDNGVGDYTLNMTSALPAATYSPTYGSLSYAANNNAVLVATHGTVGGGATTKTTTALRVRVASNASQYDMPENYVAIHCAA